MYSILQILNSQYSSPPSSWHPNAQYSVLSNHNYLIISFSSLLTTRYSWLNTLYYSILTTQFSKLSQYSRSTHL